MALAVLVAVACAHMPKQHCRYVVTGYRITMDSVLVPTDSTLVCTPVDASRRPR